MGAPLDVSVVGDEATLIHPASIFVHTKSGPDSCPDVRWGF
jgi:hypothetical protein